MPRISKNYLHMLL